MKFYTLLIIAFSFSCLAVDDYEVMPSGKTTHRGHANEQDILPTKKSPSPFFDKDLFSSSTSCVSRVDSGVSSSTQGHPPTTPVSLAPSSFFSTSAHAVPPLSPIKEHQAMDTSSESVNESDDEENDELASILSSLRLSQESESEKSPSSFRSLSAPLLKKNGRISRLSNEKKASFEL